MASRIAPRLSIVPPAAAFGAAASIGAEGARAPVDRFEAPVAISVPASLAVESARVSSRFELGSAGAVDNGFQILTRGPFPPKAAGSFFGKLHQAQMTAANSLKAEESILSHGSSPSDASVRSQLDGLHPLPVDPGTAISHADYTSDIPGTTPEQAYNLFVNNPSAAFGAGGLTVRPATSQLHDGDRLMLQAGGTPALWMPIEVHLDPAHTAIHLTTLDGHPFRGDNNFQFQSDGRGGTTVAQTSEFQGSSQLINVAGEGQLNQQHETWRGVHAFLYEQLANTTPPEGAGASGTATPNAPIQDYRTTTSRIHIDAQAPVSQLRVTLDLPHDSPSDLKIWLVSPQGTVIPVANPPTGEGGVFGTFDLSTAAKGESAQGDWTLCVSDNANGGVTGTLKDWGIAINQA